MLHPTRSTARALALAVLLLSGTAGQAAVTAIDQITVSDDAGGGGFFTVNLEENYLPNVVLRENGAASFEALKAQAVAARTFAYYKLQSNTFIRNGTSDQVYSLGGLQPSPGGRWEDAARETAGEILTFNEILIASFYVAGAIPDGPTAVADPGDPDPTNTERFVTYPWMNGLLGPQNTGSTLGFVGTPSNPNYRNRGAKSQNGADWQSDRGVHYYDILKLYYGGDIQLEQVLPTPGHGGFGVKTLASFERNNDYFNRALDFAGQTRNLGTGTQVSRSASFATTVGGTSQQLAIDYDPAADATDGQVDGFFVRHIAGVQRAARLSNITSGTALAPAADPIGNLVLPSTGSIGFWLLANPVDVDVNAAMEVSVAIDNFASGILGADTDQGEFLQVIADGTWRKYEWFLDEPMWTSAFAPGVGDGQIGDRFTLDSILLRGFGDATVYIDDVFFDASAVIPEPTTMLVMVGLGLASLVRRSNLGGTR